MMLRSASTIKGTVIVGHGRSSPKAVRNGVALAYRFASQPFLERVQREIAAAEAGIGEN